MNNKSSLKRILISSTLLASSIILAESSYKSFTNQIDKEDYIKLNSGEVDYEKYYNDLNDNHNRFWVKGVLSGVLLFSGLTYLKYHQEMSNLEESN